MIESLRIRGFRGLNDREIRKLARVNLLVGANNAGKTAVLDAVELLMRDGHPRTLASLAGRRSGEYASFFDYREGASLPFAVRYLFHGYADGGEASFSLACTGTPTREISLSWQDRSEDGAYPDAAQIQVLRNGKDAETIGVGSHTTEESATHRTPGRVQFVSPFGATAKSLHPLWGSIVGNPDEDQVLEAMQLLDGRIDRLVFSTDAEDDRSPNIFVRLKGVRDRVPLSSLGDGIRRMLGIAIRAVKARDGWLLLDEVDSGLHFSAMEQLWRWLISFTERCNIQVFATTHSSDCVNALGRLHAAEPELAASVATYRLDPGQVVLTRYSAQEMEVVAENGLEVRG
jgi:energy-coupling factor transporter ATP-binding protein EcfA2